MIIGVIIFLGGFAGGLFIKEGFDYYNNYLKRQNETIDNLAKLNAKWELMEEMKKQDFKNRETA